MKKEWGIFDLYIREKGLRRTPQRQTVLEVFLRTEGHVSADELHRLVRKTDKALGYTTIYRTLKLLSECGLAREVDFGDGIARFEHSYEHAHHDHLICTKCGKHIEVIKPALERLQDELAREHGFTPTDHKLQIFGLCRGCSKR